jgi:hypothetical protein
MKWLLLTAAMFVCGSPVLAEDAGTEAELLQWAHNAGQDMAAPPPEKPLFADRNPELTPTPRLRRPTGIKGAVKLAGHAVGSAGATAGRACTSFGRAYRCNDYIRPTYMKADERTAPYSNTYSVETNRQGKGRSELQTVGKPIMEVSH